MGDRAGQLEGKWRILDGKVESGLMLDSELQGGSPRLCRVRTDRLAPLDSWVESSCIMLISLTEVPCLPHDGFRTLE
jgi:hypothetical protein